MSKKTTSVLLWVLAFVLTLTIAVYQRLTGPTHPVRGSETIQEKTVKFKLLRSHTEHQTLPVVITAPDPEVKAFLSYKRYKTSDDWKEEEMTRDGDTLNGGVPGQPSAGKMEYMIRLQAGEKPLLLNDGESIVARFKGAVPAIFLIPHVIFMFFSILFALRTGLEALRKDGNYFKLVNWTLGLVFVGGMILGPIVQKYAFGDLWTGFPYGIDLTDNKTLLAFIFWVVAFFLKKKSKWWVLLATIMMIVVYLIPHSVMGSELDYESGKMKNKYGVARPPLIKGAANIAYKV